MTSEPKDIDKIIDGCKKQDRKAQEMLYRNYYKAMMTLCLRYTKNETDALEVMNTGFYKIYKNIEKFNKQQASLYTWMRTILINTCLDFIKTKETRTVFGELEQADSVDVPPVAISKMSAAEILQLVRALPAATQAVFNLYVMEGYNHNEIAAMMNISSGTSKWHLSEARKKLQQLINEASIIK